MSEGVSDSLKDALAERIKSPVWGYIAISWFGFNWKNLAVLFMSKETVQERINHIITQENYLLYGYTIPILIGLGLAVISPYGQLILSYLHKWGDGLHRKNLSDRKSSRYQESIQLSDLKVKADRAEKRQNIIEDALDKAEEEKGKRETLKTKELESERDLLVAKIDSLKLSANETQKILDVYRSDVIKYHYKIARLLNLTNQVLEVKNEFDLASFASNAREIVSDIDLERAMLSYKMEAEGNMSEKEFERYVEILGEDMSEYNKNKRNKEAASELAND
ncbi:hypothetical protein NFJ83_10135 [Citrobacter braakii]|uniref:hypothetical protein n=1 Tax=Citrobacter braakii TaxID=57706 RepID=UPI00242C689F|nr:hypothetical protein [Citrobacter braakii]WFW79831.1 hypothetical protein NFJ83_10135 [Citrobacter braakii]